MTTPSPDARPPETDVEVIARLTRDLEDLRSTMLARTSRSRTGKIEPTALDVADPDAVLLQGQTLTKAAYPALWQWVSDNTPRGFVVASTTFTLPDWRGRSPVGATAARPAGTLYGASSRVIAPANMAAHTHQVSVDAHGNLGHPADIGSDEVSHTHGFGTSGVGDHGFHRPATTIGPGGNGAAWTNTTHVGDGAHGHNGGTGNASNAHGHYATIFQASAGGHTVRQVAVGENDPFNIESPAVCVNWQIFV